MYKDTSMRNILMLQMIPREPHTITADTLRERLADQGYDIHLRTIQRDLNKCSLKFAIRNLKSEDSNANCWCWNEDASLWDMPKMTPMTALTFNLVEKFLNKIIPGSILNYMAPHFNRAAHLLNKLRGSRWGGWTDKIHIIPRGLRLIPPDIDQSVYETVFESVLTGKLLRISYRKRNAAELKDYLLNPLGLVFNQEVVYLVASKEGITNKQQFALHRMKSVDIENREAHIPKNFDLKSYIDGGAFQYRVNGDQIKLKAEFDGEIAKHLYESKLSPDQKLTRQRNGKVQLQAEIQNSSALKWWLLAFGDGVEVLGPQELRDEFAKIVKNLGMKYNIRD